jgi:hypothetical protein
MDTVGAAVVPAAAAAGKNEAIISASITINDATDTGLLLLMDAPNLALAALPLGLLS